MEIADYFKLKSEIETRKHFFLHYADEIAWLTIFAGALYMNSDDKARKDAMDYADAHLQLTGVMTAKPS